MGLLLSLVRYFAYGPRAYSAGVADSQPLAWLGGRMVGFLLFDSLRFTTPRRFIQTLSRLHTAASRGATTFGQFAKPLEDTARVSRQSVTYCLFPQALEFHDAAGSRCAQWPSRTSAACFRA